MIYNIGTTIAAVIIIASTISIVGLVIAAIQILIKKIKSKNE